MWSCGCPVLLWMVVVVGLRKFGEIRVVLAERRVVGVLLRGFGTFGQQSVRYLVDSVAVSMRWRCFFITDEFAIGVHAESGERRPLQGVAEILESARRRLKPRPLPPAQSQAAARREDHQHDQCESPTTCS